MWKIFSLFDYRFNQHRSWKKKKKPQFEFCLSIFNVYLITKSKFLFAVMTDTPTTTTMGNDNDDWEVAVDTGEFDKRLEQQEKARAANQVNSNLKLLLFVFFIKYDFRNL
jgi:hypothetical protein